MGKRLVGGKEKKKKKKTPGVPSGWEVHNQRSCGLTRDTESKGRTSFRRETSRPGALAPGTVEPYPTASSQPLYLPPTEQRSVRRTSPAAGYKTPKGRRGNEAGIRKPPQLENPSLLKNEGSQPTRREGGQAKLSSPFPTGMDA